ncbi:MAG TPA: delta-60 repeat domain-containing protein, partial [Ardenticatenaceae bacterium]|nr:delta-60 repeat domain-containing protein [Ardenticatenaceae bacterium]
MSNKTRLFVPMALLLLGSALVAITYAADGDLDPTFGNGGTVVTSFDDPAVIRDVAVQVDGRIVAAGYTYRPSIPEWSDFALARYLPNGSLDPTFDG